MWFYIFLIAEFLLFSLIIKQSIKDRQKQEKIILSVGMFALFLVLALKGENVGNDITGYKEQYYLTKQHDWGDFGYVYFEDGYIALTMFFAKLGFSFRFFMGVIYAIWCFAIYKLIDKFSPDVTLSVIIFICYDFFVFSISGVRQTIAMALCLIALFLFLRPKLLYKILSIAIIISAIYIHESAIVFFAVIALLFMKNKINVMSWVYITIGVFVFRSFIWSIVDFFYNRIETSFSIAGNFVFLIGMVFFVGYNYWYVDRKRTDEQKLEIANSKFLDFDAFFVRTSFLALICHIVFSGSGLLRSNMYFMLFLISAIPNGIAKYSPKMRTFLSIAMGVFMLALFYFETLVPNLLSLWPYTFFWNDSLT